MLWTIAIFCRLIYMLDPFSVRRALFHFTLPLTVITQLGEHVLASVSLERFDGMITGHIRIRSKTQGIALTLGDRVAIGMSLHEVIDVFVKFTGRSTKALSVKITLTIDDQYPDAQYHFKR